MKNGRWPPRKSFAARNYIWLRRSRRAGHLCSHHMTRASGRGTGGAAGSAANSNACHAGAPSHELEPQATKRGMTLGMGHDGKTGRQEWLQHDERERSRRRNTASLAHKWFMVVRRCATFLGAGAGRRGHEAVSCRGLKNEVPYAINFQSLKTARNASNAPSSEVNFHGAMRRVGDEGQGHPQHHPRWLR